MIITATVQCELMADKEYGERITKIMELDFAQVKDPAKLDNTGLIEKTRNL